MPKYYRPRMTFLRANAVKRKMDVVTEAGKIGKRILIG